MALFAWYWKNVHTTVDEPTTPFRETAFQNQLFLYGAAASMALIAIGKLIARLNETAGGPMTPIEDVK